MAPLLQLSGVVAGWPGAAEKPVAGGFSLALAAGEIVGLAGPNGIGKSSLLALIAGGGACCVAGELQRAAGLRINWQRQEVPPFAGLPLNGHELLALTGAAAAGLPPWLADKLDWRLDRLSGGQRHFLALWAVLQAPGDLVLLDEPTNNLDVAGARWLAAHLRDRAAAGAGLLVVSHDADFLAACCDRIVHLEAAHAVDLA